MGECEKCHDQALGYNDDSELLCEDCLFEYVCEEMVSDDREDD